MSAPTLVQIQGEQLPRGLCWCGCGAATKIAKGTDRSRGSYKGVAHRYVHGHFQTPSVEERFWAKVDKTETCWLWTAQLDRHGYGRFWFTDSLRAAHRVAYELEVGPIPAGMEIDHACHTPACVKPTHLRPVTKKQNMENLLDARRDSRSGVRGVYWREDRQRWIARVQHNGREYTKAFTDFDDASKHVVDLRNELYTHNDADRVAS